MDITHIILQLLKTVMLLYMGLSYNLIQSLPVTKDTIKQLSSTRHNSNNDIQRVSASKELPWAEFIANSVVKTPESENASKRYRRLCKYHLEVLIE